MIQIDLIVRTPNFKHPMWRVFADPLTRMAAEAVAEDERAKHSPEVAVGFDAVDIKPENFVEIPVIVEWLDKIAEYYGSAKRSGIPDEEVMQHMLTQMRPLVAQAATVGSLHGVTVSLNRATMALINGQPRRAQELLQSDIAYAAKKAIFGYRGDGLEDEDDECEEQPAPRLNRGSAPMKKKASRNDPLDIVAGITLIVSDIGHVDITATPVPTLLVK